MSQDFLIRFVTVLVFLYGTGCQTESVKEKIQKTDEPVAIGVNLTQELLPLRLKTKFSTSSSATSFPASRAIDGRIETIWMASKSTSSKNNLAWVELTLNTTTYVSSFNWRSPNGAANKAFYPASAPSRFKISITSDGKSWTDAFETDGKAIFDGKITIGRPIKKIRMDISKVNDGTGWALGFSEIWLEGWQEPQKACSLILGPMDDYKSALKSIGTGPKTVCLKEGVYSGPIRIDNAKDVEIIAYLGIPKIISKTDTFSLPKSPDNATLVISRSQNIVLDGLTIHNSYRLANALDPESTNKGVSRALEISTSNNIRIQNSSVRSEGKQTVQIIGGIHVLSDSIIKGYYFLIDARNSDSVKLDNMSLVSDFEILPSDGHSAIWTTDANLIFTNLSLVTRSGRGFLSGYNNSLNWVVSLNKTTSIGNLKEWVQVHPNYRNLRLELRGSYPKTATFFYNPFQGGGPSPGTSVCFYALDNSLLKCD